MKERPLERAWRTALDEYEWAPPEGWDERVRSLRRRQTRHEVTTAVAFTGWTVFAVGWDEDSDHEVRSRVRVTHALRAHESVGAAYRDEVTDRAESIVSTSQVGVFGWPAAAAMTVWIAVTADSIEGRVLCLALAAVFVGALVGSQRRAAQARRWLADPLPRS